MAEFVLGLYVGGAGIAWWLWVRRHGNDIVVKRGKRWWE